MWYCSSLELSIVVVSRRDLPADHTGSRGRNEIGGRASSWICMSFESPCWLKVGKGMFGVAWSGGQQGLDGKG